MLASLRASASSLARCVDALINPAKTISSAPITRTVDAVSFPGVSEESKLLVHQLLTENNKRNDVFFNDMHFHNHVVHHILDVYSLGASPTRLRQIYDDHQSIQRPIPPRSTPITEENWTQHLGKAKLWPDYLDFFNQQIQKSGAQQTMEKYLFHPELFGRMFSGIFHPFIQLGFGVEFRMPMIVSEGLAEAALHKNELEQFLSLSPASSSAGSVPILELLATIRGDKRLDKAVTFRSGDKFQAVVDNAADVVKEYLEKWHVAGTEEDVKQKQKELFESIVLMYAAVVRPGKSPKFDFFLMHSLTSSLFVHVMLQHFSWDKSAVILKAHFAVTLLHYIARGRPELYVDNLKAYQTKLPASSNTWFDIIKFAIDTPDTHAMKVVRSLLQAEALYGCNNSIFLKAAQITADTFVGVPSIMYSHPAWEHSGIGWDEVWNDNEGIHCKY